MAMDPIVWKLVMDPVPNDGVVRKRRRKRKNDEKMMMVEYFYLSGEMMRQNFQKILMMTATKSVRKVWMIVN